MDQAVNRRSLIAKTRVPLWHGSYGNCGLRSHHGTGFSQIILLFLLNITPPLRTQLHLHATLISRAMERNLGTFKKSMISRKSASIEQNCFRFFRALKCSVNIFSTSDDIDLDDVVGIAIGYEPNGPGIKSRSGCDFPLPS